ncbi:hypothetical protein PTKIN_Ptkin04bG0244900 [Pterospermum kingtungense]
MADFSFLSDTDESAVEEVISQAQDLCVLEQLSAINCSAFTHSDSVLPSDLDSRFRRLKSLPVPVTHTSPDYVSDSKSNHDPFLPEHPTSSSSDSLPQNSSVTKSCSFASPLPLDSSPPRKAGCFWCSFKMPAKKKHTKKNRVLNTALDSDEFLSDMAVKEQQKMINKAIKGQEKVIREAEKMVNLAKQASARMIFLGMEDELSYSDDEPAK